MIESIQNDNIKYLQRLLTDNRFRKKAGVFAVEGRQENERAQRFGYEPAAFFICEQIYDQAIPPGKINYVSDKIYEKLAYRGKTEGIIGIYDEKTATLTDLRPQKDSAVIIVEGMEKPGNLGAILRSCEAFGIDSLIVTEGKVDFYNPNVIRSSVGCLFGMNIYQSTNEEVYDFLQENDFQIFTTMMSDGAGKLQDRNFTKRSAVLFGTEHSGLSDFWKGIGDNTLIPMAGTIDSLNLSNAVAITCYEILRQKMA